MMMALAGMHDLPGVLVPGGVTLPPADGEDAGKVQTIGARFAHGELDPGGGRRAGLPGLRLARRRLPVPRHGRHRRRSWPRRWACPCRTPPWPRRASRSGSTWPAARPGPLASSGAAGSDRAGHPHRRRDPQRDGRPRRVRRLDEPAAAHPGDRPRRRPAAADRRRLERASTARCRASSSVLPNGPVGHPTVRVFLAGGVPEVMLHLRGSACSTQDVLTVTGEPLGEHARLVASSRAPPAPRASGCTGSDGVDPDDVIMSPGAGRASAA